MYDEHSVQIPAALPQQKPIPKPRSLQVAESMTIDAHAWERMQERGYTQEQVRQTLREGHEQADPRGNPDVSRYFLTSADHANMRRGIVVDRSRNRLKTALSRTPIEEAPTAPRPSNGRSTKAKQREQLARKRARSMP